MGDIWEAEREHTSAHGIIRTTEGDDPEIDELYNAFYAHGYEQVVASMNEEALDEYEEFVERMKQRRLLYPAPKEPPHYHPWRKRR